MFYRRSLYLGVPDVFSWLDWGYGVWGKQVSDILIMSYQEMHYFLNETHNEIRIMLEK